MPISKEKILELEAHCFAAVWAANSKSIIEELTEFAKEIDNYHTSDARKDLQYKKLQDFLKERTTSMAEAAAMEIRRYIVKTQNRDGFQENHVLELYGDDRHGM